MWRKIFLLKGMGFRVKAVEAGDHFMSQFSINILLKSADQMLCGNIGCAELLDGAVNGSEFHCDRY